MFITLHSCLTMFIPTEVITMQYFLLRGDLRTNAQITTSSDFSNIFIALPQRSLRHSLNNKFICTGM